MTIDSFLNKNENPKIIEALARIESLNPKIYRRFLKANSSVNSFFTIVFPDLLSFYYENFDLLLYQLEIFLEHIGIPFQAQRNIEDFYSNLFTSKYSGEIIFDLSQTKYIYALEMLNLLILGNFFYEISKKTILVKMTMPVVEFLAGFNFFEHFIEWGELEENFAVELLSSTQSDPVLLPIRKISNYSDVGATLDNIYVKAIESILIRDYGMNKTLIKSFVIKVISEICNNIPQHSKGEGYIMVWSRWFSKGDDLPNIEIAISDFGIGIRQSLYNRFPKEYKNESHYQVIKDVLVGNFPYPDDESHGGILRARQFVDNLNGQIYIRSICAKAGNRSYPEDIDEDWRFLPGTQVNILIPKLAIKLKEMRKFGKKP